MKFDRRLLAGAGLAALVTSGLLADAAVAQTTTPVAAATDDSGATIIVTGSRIRRSVESLDAPVAVIGQDTIARTGLSSTADILQRLPSASGGLNGKVNSSGNFGNPPDGGGVGAGSADIELRYLSSRRTLTIMDGLRFVNGSSASGIPASVDLNAIPAAMIERVEVLQSGASPIYGSDAIAGVVNIITKEHQDGLQASAQFGSFRQGDGHTQDYNLSYGVHGPSTEVVFGASYVKQDGVSSGDRAISLFPEPGATSCLAGGCSSATPLGRFITQYGSLTLKGPVAGKPRLDTEDPTGPNSDFKPFTTADRFNFAPYNYVLTPSQRFGAFISVKQELTDNITFRVKAIYSHRQSDNQAAPLPLFVGPDAGNGNLLDHITIAADNPYNPFGVLSAGNPGDPPANYSFIGRRVVENGPRHYTQYVNTEYVTATLDGSFHVGDHKFFWDVNAVLGWADARQRFSGNINALKLQQALGPLAGCTGECVPFNIFGGTGSITPAMLGFVAFTENDRSSQSLRDYTANLSGELFDLPAGPVGIAVGYERRVQAGTFDPDPVVAAGFGSDIPALPSKGGITADEFYGEVRVPILKDVPGFQSLEASGAIRHSHYSSFGSTTTFTGGGTWKPVSDLVLRGSYAEGFRAPSIGELYGTPSRFDQELVDPCSDLSNSGASAQVKANCIAQGVPANGSYVQPNPQLSVVTGGNNALKPETSRTLVFGGTYNAGWARTQGLGSLLSLEANYYDIKVSGAIAPIGADVLLNRCALTLDAFSCAAVKRTANGNVAQITGLLQNIGGIKTRGIDATFNYRSLPGAAGTFGLSATATFLLKYQEAVPATVGQTIIDRTGTERGSPDQAFPKFKGNFVLDWSLGAIEAAFTGRYISGVTESQNGNRLGARFYGDVQVVVTPGWMNKRTSLAIGVNNLFNTQPPGCISCGLNNFDPTTYDVPGQFGYIRLSYKM